MLSNLLSNPLVTQVLPIIFFTNMGLSALNYFLTQVINATGNAEAKTLDGYVNQISSYLQWVLNAVGYAPKQSVKEKK